MKKTLYALLAFVTLFAAMCVPAMAQNDMPQQFAQNTFVIKDPGMPGYVAPVHKPDPFKNTIFTIKNPGQPGFVKRGGDGGGITDKGRDSRGNATGGLGGNPGRGGIAGRS